MRRLIAIGDIHGHYELLIELMAEVAPTIDDLFVFLGDYVDRGPSSPAVLDWLIDFKQQFTQTVILRGNHEQMLLDAVAAVKRKSNRNMTWLDDFFALQRHRLPDPVLFFVSCGGMATLQSYHSGDLDADLTEAFLNIPQGHLDFLQQTQFYFTYDQFMFVHAGVNPKDPTGEKDEHNTLLWERRPLWKSDKNWDKVVVHGHTPVEVPYFDATEINLDTGAGHSGCLTACNVLTRQVWQAPDLNKRNYPPFT